MTAETGMPGQNDGTATGVGDTAGAAAGGDGMETASAAGSELPGSAAANGTASGTPGMPGTESTAAGGGASGPQVVIIRSGTGGSGAGTDGTGASGGGTDAGTETGVAVMGAGGGAGGTAAGSGALTGVERIIILEGELNEQLGEFDDMILARRSAVIRQDDIEGSHAGTSGSGDGDGGAGTENAATAPVLVAMAKGSNGANSNSGGGAMPALPGDNRQGEFSNADTRVAEIPADIPDGSDDDIVARQLREAAMKETDPKLREKLWDEYRKYKQGVMVKR
jgi:hypothetical protein